ncbi:hypothetical protein PENSPDRAFT_646549 [Peniophora sp. CONT]|nr:hypothetical protein PENSPDRAFT_646549 [Peniophora sp. CONT]
MLLSSAHHPRSAYIKFVRQKHSNIVLLESVHGAACHSEHVALEDLYQKRDSSVSEIGEALRIHEHREVLRSLVRGR